MPAPARINEMAHKSDDKEKTMSIVQEYFKNVSDVFRISARTRHIPSPPPRNSRNLWRGKHSFLDNPTFRGMRSSLMKTFDKIYVLDLHGNSKKKETAPDGSKDENVFDIQQGVAISIFIKKNCFRKFLENAGVKP